MAIPVRIKFTEGRKAVGLWAGRIRDTYGRAAMVEALMASSDRQIVPAVRGRTPVRKGNLRASVATLPASRGLSGDVRFGDLGYTAYVSVGYRLGRDVRSGEAGRHGFRDKLILKGRDYRAIEDGVSAGRAGFEKDFVDWAERRMTETADRAFRDG